MESESESEKESENEKAKMEKAAQKGGALNQGHAHRRVVEETRRLLAEALPKSGAQVADASQLARPPFSCIQALVRALMDERRLLRDVFNSRDFARDKESCSRRAKVEFVAKLVDFVAARGQRVVNCSAERVLAGLEPNKTNELLQALARCAIQAQPQSQSQSQRRPPATSARSEARTKQQLPAGALRQRPNNEKAAAQKAPPLAHASRAPPRGRAPKREPSHTLSRSQKGEQTEEQQEEEAKEEKLAEEEEAAAEGGVARCLGEGGLSSLRCALRELRESQGLLRQSLLPLLRRQRDDAPVGSEGEQEN